MSNTHSTPFAVKNKNDAEVLQELGHKVPGAHGRTEMLSQLDARAPSFAAQQSKTDVVDGAIDTDWRNHAQGHGADTKQGLSHKEADYSAPSQESINRKDPILDSTTAKEAFDERQSTLKDPARETNHSIGRDL